MNNKYLIFERSIMPVKLLEVIESNDMDFV